MSEVGGPSMRREICKHAVQAHPRDFFTERNKQINECYLFFMAQPLVRWSSSDGPRTPWCCHWSHSFPSTSVTTLPSFGQQKIQREGNAGRRLHMLYPSVVSPLILKETMCHVPYPAAGDHPAMDSPDTIVVHG